MSEQRGPATHGVSRRTVTTAAWTVPVVVVAAAAPAMAASGPAALAVSLVPPVRVLKPLTTQQDLVNVVATITNANDQATTELTVVVDVTSAPSAPFDFVNASATAGPGYTLVGRERPPGIDRRFVFAATEQLGGNASTQFTAVVDLDIGSAGTLVVTALPGAPGTPGTASADFL